MPPVPVVPARPRFQRPRSFRRGRPHRSCPRSPWSRRGPPSRSSRRSPWSRRARRCLSCPRSRFRPRPSFRRCRPSYPPHRRSRRGSRRAGGSGAAAGAGCCAASPPFPLVPALPEKPSPAAPVVPAAPPWPPSAAATRRSGQRQQQQRTAGAAGRKWMGGQTPRAVPTGRDREARTVDLADKARAPSGSVFPDRRLGRNRGRQMSDKKYSVNFATGNGNSSRGGRAGC